jgi:EpsI family protein
LILTDRVLGYLLPSRLQRDRAALRPKVESGSQLEASPEAATDSSGARSSGRLGDAALTALAVAMLGASIWTPRWSAPEEIRVAPITLPAELDGWTRGETVSLDQGFLYTVRFVRFDYRIYQRDGDQVFVFIGENDRSRRGRSILSRKNALPRRGFEVEERDSVALEPIEARVERVVARSESTHVLTYHWYQGTEALVFEILRELFATDQSPFRRSQPARVIRVATVLGSSPTARAEDEAKLRAFTASLAVALRE